MHCSNEGLSGCAPRSLTGSERLQESYPAKLMTPRDIAAVDEALDPALDEGAISAAEGVRACPPSLSLGSLEDLSSDELRIFGRTLLYALRHAPEAYGLIVDDGGWVDLNDLVAGLRASSPGWERITKRQLLEFVIWYGNGKGRYELRGNRIRALYGHSFTLAIVRVPASPPAVLYHGTTSEAFAHIRLEGLKTMGRQFVHLTSSLEYAASIKKRHSGRPVMLTIAARYASENGIAFYHATNSIWLTPAVPVQFILIVPHPQGKHGSRCQQRFLDDGGLSPDFSAGAVIERRM